VKPMTPPALDHSIKKCLQNSLTNVASASDLASELKWIRSESTLARWSRDGELGRRPGGNRSVDDLVAVAALLAVGLVRLLLAPFPSTTYAFFDLPPVKDSSYAQSGKIVASVSRLALTSPP